MKLFPSPRLLVSFFLTLFLPLTTFAWNAVGHMVVANIAYQNLTPQVRAKVDKLVGILNQEYPEMKTFMNIAYWPDALRSQHIETFTHWHYIDNPYLQDGTPAPQDLIDTDNAVWAVNAIKQIVRNNNANEYDRARFLSFMTHLVGDLHQPLHTVALVSAAHPTGDKGGNTYVVKMNNEKVNAHKIWDMGLGAFGGSDSSPERATKLANEIMTTYPQSYFGEAVKKLSTDDWANEGMDNAKRYVYSTPENQAVSTAYIETGKQVAQKQAALAGYRLAGLLNQLLG